MPPRPFPPLPGLGLRQVCVLRQHDFAEDCKRVARRLLVQRMRRELLERQASHAPRPMPPASRPTAEIVFAARSPN